MHCSSLVSHKMGERYLAVLLVLFFAVNSFGRDDFKWSWGKKSRKQDADQGSDKVVSADGGEETTTNTAQVAVGKQASSAAPVVSKSSEKPPAASEAFVWSWDEKGGSRKAAGTSVSGESPVKSADSEAASPPPVVSGIDADDYNQLVKDNLILRRELSTAQRENEKGSAVNAQLSREISEMDARISESAGMIQAMKVAAERRAKGDGETKVVDDGAVTAGDTTSKVAELELRNDKAAKEIASLTSQLAAARKREAEFTTSKSGVKSDSPLFSVIERENAALRGQLAELEKDRARQRKVYDTLLKRGTRNEEGIKEAKEREDAFKRELKALEDRDYDSRKTIQQLLAQIPQLEKKVDALEEAGSDRSDISKAQERELGVLREELKRREHRLRKAEKMAVMMDSARRDMTRVDSRQKRDMHFNMGAVYAKEGRHKDAEQEYLHALQLDSSDAECHYNLGILYDDELKDARRASMHYRRYMKLRPHSPDSDMVKSWLVRRELAQK